MMAWQALAAAPLFDNGARVFEVHVFDFDDDLYGERVKVILHGYLRKEEKFESLDALIAQMGRDSEQSRCLLAAVPPLSELEQRLWVPR